MEILNFQNKICAILFLFLALSNKWVTSLSNMIVSKKETIVVKKTLLSYYSKKYLQMFYKVKISTINIGLLNTISNKYRVGIFQGFF